jgi:uncharacterized protein YkwD
MLRILPCCVLVLIVSVLPAGQAKPFEQTPDEIKISELTNKERKEKDGPALVLNAALSKIARAHSENMARQGKMEHTLDDKTPFERIKAAGYKYSTAGENIAMGEEGAELPRIMQAWMESEGHRKNILSPEYTEIGVGSARAKDGSLYFTQVFARPRK